MLRIYLIILLLASSASSLAGIELLIGGGLGKLDFKTDSPRDDSYTGSTQQLQGTARGTLTKGRFQIGAGITGVLGKVSFDAKSGSDTSSEFKHLYYGPVVGYIVNKGFRLDFEYYTDSTIEMTKTDDHASDIFHESDKTFGRGFGVGVSLLRDYFITQLLYQSFSPKRVELSDEEFDADFDAVNSFNIQSLSLQIGLLF